MEERPHIIAFPFPAQGHINPMFQFSKILASKGIKITLITFIDEDLIKPIKESSITVETIAKKGEETEISNFEDYINNLKSKFRQKLTEIVENQEMINGVSSISCLVFDSIMPWSLEIAKEFGIMGASLFTQSCAVSAIWSHIFNGEFEFPMEQEARTRILLDGLPILEIDDLPCPDGESEPSNFVNMCRDQFYNLKQADWIFFNSFNSLEDQVVNWLLPQFPIKLIGPTNLSSNLDKKSHNNNLGLSLFKPKINNCMEWLNSKKSHSVIYVSFGSMITLTEKQTEELANALKSSSHHFLWVVRESEENKLPKTFLDETSEKGLVVNWCSQAQVLAHKSVGCFVTHCGWNSTIEALSLGVPMVAMPQYWDQPTHGKFVAEVWKVGVRVKVNEEGIVKQEELEQCIKEVIEGERANEIRNNSENWKKLVQEAVSKGGSSDKNIEEFVAQLKWSKWNST